MHPCVAMAKIEFVDVTVAAGIFFQHSNGATGEKHIPETMGSGVAFIDYDGDGRLDLYFVNSAGPAALYRNRGSEGFEEMTGSAGVADSGYGMGCAAADYDNDGDLDLYVTAYGPNLLYRSRGDGTFIDAAEMAGVNDSGFGTSSAFADVDLDGDLDLYVANYLEYGPHLNQRCARVEGIRIYCGPDVFEPERDVFYRNDGTGKFEDATEAVGLLPQDGKELGALFADYDLDGDPDLFVAGDRTPNLLYRNDGDRFAQVGLRSGIAYNDEGEPLAGMGVDAGDYDRDGSFDLFVTNFQRETNSLYRNLGNGFFGDVTFPSGLGVPSINRMGWGTALFDYDNDGDCDLFVANSHLDANHELFDDVKYAQQNQLFNNDGGRFSEVTDAAGPGLALEQVSRGSAIGDFDDDGDLDLVISNNGQPAALLRNDGGNQHHWLTLSLAGSGQPLSNRSAIGARAELEIGDLRLVDEVRSGSSYLSQDDLRLFFGLGNETRIERITVYWPSGIVQELEQIGADQILTVHEPGE